MVAILGLPLLLLPRWPARIGQQDWRRLTLFKGWSANPADATENDCAPSPLPSWWAEATGVRTDSLGQAELAFFEGNLTEFFPIRCLKSPDSISRTGLPQSPFSRVGDMRPGSIRRSTRVASK
jgi:hypothetical protein